MKSLIKFIVLITIPGLVSCNSKSQERILNFEEYQIHIKETGKGKPTVIIEAGLGSGYDAYDTLQTAISPLTKVVSYDRPGLGESSESPNRRTLPNYINELRLLLQKEDIDSPYILVGHSLGGLIMRYYAHKYPNEVAGLVLIDCIPEGWINYIMSTHSKEEIDELNKVINPELNNSKGVIKDEWQEFQNNCELIKGVQLSKHIPIRVITAIQYGKDQKALGYHPEDMQIWAQMQANFMANSTNAKQIITDKSGHSVQLTEPELIIDAIKELVKLNRKNFNNH
ncbi:MAG: alpha/beta fold hydrolase [Candidatus Heimdallarchaeota archaeon]